MSTRDRLLALEAFGIKLGLGNMQVLVTALEHPDRAYRAIHVAGTNGKGSVCAMVERTLRAAGYRTGLYTSPHLDRLEERIALDGEPVNTGRFEAAAGRVLALVDEARADGRLTVSPTFFEVTTAIALDIFREAGVDVAVIEVGLGGRFDATNVITPVAGAITSIAFDHERHLGSTLSLIAAEKAGIAKRAVPLVVGALPAEAMAVVEHTARGVGAPVVYAEGAVEVVGIERGRARVHPVPWPEQPALDLSLPGRHQIQNATTAVRLLAVLRDQAGLPVGGEAVGVGLTTARWPARLEWLRLPHGGTLLIDAAHNPAGAEALAAYLEDAGEGPLPVVLAAMQDKDIAGMVRPLGRVASRFITTGVDMPRAFEAEALAARVSEVLPDAKVAPMPGAAAAIASALRDGRAVAAGSIYFVGPLRARLIESGAVLI